jgi:hypothetical protein
MEAEILRPQYDGRKQKWRIAKKTSNGSGGWRSFGSGAVYVTRSEAERKIEMIIENMPGYYQKEEK